MNNNFNGYCNFKGVMLCVRPQDKIKSNFEKPFCSMVQNLDQIGLNPVKKEKIHYRKKKTNNFKTWMHKKFIKSLQNENKEKKLNYFNEVIKRKEKEDKLRQTMKIKRDIIRGVVLPETITEDNIEFNKTKKIEKPSWACTKKEIEERENKECDEMLEFLDNFDCDDYLKKLDDDNLIKTLNDKIDNIKKEENWLDLLDKRVKDKQDKDKEIEENIKLNNQDRNVSEDNIFADNISENDEEEEQDKLNNSDIIETNEDKICYNLAKEILKNNRAMAQIHSNLSLQKILQKNRFNKNNEC